MATHPEPQGVHLVGSVPLNSAEEVFATAFKSLPGRLRRCPDGETGERRYFVAWQRRVLAKEYLRVHDVHDRDSWWRERKRDDIHKTPTEHDDAAISSYASFAKLRLAGLIPQGVRFQVSLPTPLGVVASHIDPKHQSVVEEMYEKRLLKAVRRIQDEIPAEDLAIQWDVAADIGLIEHEMGSFNHPIFEPWFSPVKEGVLDRIVRLSAAVDPGVELGYHLCYGDLHHKHFVEPKDTGLLVEIANEIVRRVQHPVKWVHMPVPKDRVDVAYFAPLSGLKLDKNTELYLGVVHAHDREGTVRTIEAAQQVVKEFGVATECGMGRTPPEEVGSILEISASVSVPW